jgi:hypothetical protein
VAVLSVIVYPEIWKNFFFDSWAVEFMLNISSRIIIDANMIFFMFKPVKLRLA